MTLKHLLMDSGLVG